MGQIRLTGVCECNLPTALHLRLVFSSLRRHHGGRATLPARGRQGLYPLGNCQFACVTRETQATWKSRKSVSPHLPDNFPPPTRRPPGLSTSSPNDVEHLPLKPQSSHFGQNRPNCAKHWRETLAFVGKRMAQASHVWRILVDGGQTLAVSWPLNLTNMLAVCRPMLAKR